MARSGRFAALTNFRDPPSHRADAPSRGGLVTGFLESEQSPQAYLDALVPQADAYNGFNLLVADNNRLLGFCNRGEGVQRLASGIHGISNGILDEPWPKVDKGRAALAAAIDPNLEPEIETLLTLLMDRSLANEADLPDTGIGEEWERLLSARFIAAPGYGTRCSTVLLWDVDGQVRFVERSFNEQGTVSASVDFSFQVLN